MKQKILDYSFIVLGNLVLALAVGTIIVPGNILSGGVSGIAIALFPIIKVKVEYVVYFLQIVLFLLGTVFLGKQFVQKTLLSTILYPVFLWVILRYNLDLKIENPLIASIYGGIGVGVGLGLAFRANASTGGVDILAFIGAKYTSIQLSVWVMIIDVLTILLGIATYGVEKSLVGIVSVYTATVAINKILLLGAHESISLFVISDEYKKIINEIHTTFDRGCTILKGIGAYSQKDRPVVLVVLSKKEYPRMQRIIKDIDPNSFTIVNDTKEVHGEGFLQEFSQ